MSALMRSSLKVKLIGLCFFMAAIVVVVGVISYRGLNEVEHIFSRVTTQVMPKAAAANHMLVEYRRVRIQLRTLGLPGLSKAQVEEAISGVNDAIASYEKARDLYVSYGFIEGQKPLYDELDAKWIAFKAIGVKVLDLQKKFEESGKSQFHDEMIKIFLTDCPDSAKAYTAAVMKVLEFHERIAQTRVKEADAASDTANAMILTMIVGGVVMGLGIGFLFATWLSRSIKQAADSISQTVDQVASASAQIAESSGGLSRATNEQAAFLQETASSLEQINAMISKAAGSADSTADRSGESHQKAEQGRGAMTKMLEAMDEIGQSTDAIMTQVNESNIQMREIAELIHEIGAKTQVINEIVFQTKLLSFNASVEAARAGEHGKGFAVVAEEVGSLAQMSGNAAKEITTMLDNSISKVEKIVSDTKVKVELLVAEGKTKVASGTEVAQHCSTVLDEIAENVSQVSKLAREISQATREQAQGVSEINTAMGQLDRVTQQNAAASEEAASASSSLQGQGQVLQSVVRGLVGIVDGNVDTQSAA